MPTIRIAEDEAWPDYILDVDNIRHGVELDVPEDVATRWREARAAWDQAANEINAAYRAIEFADQRARFGMDGEPPYPGRRIR